ncbi:hypothetical protein [Methylobacterium planeticum]|uniref:PepSY domain-containing protein n=1 Tax=Methylobacterium planeticum TaxID=2615211 RepID=A0A6N6MZJ9_9HYPH|nr:hypothetical protein [Methylobacterium planeticum]KAB1075105.1 hypothetical protein F6X51_04240 [Methylobacterium planeticum]
MRTTLALAAVLTLAGAGAASAQASPAPDPNSETKAGPHSGGMPHGTVGAKLETGANSFTEGQVKDRFAKMGFGEVKDLKKDDQGIWRGMATHAGKEVSIGMDYKGNVAAQ